MKLLVLLIFFVSSLMSKPLIIAHRGASGYEPENTLRAFKKAVELGAKGIELDVYLCKSREVVVIHDDTVDRTTNGTGLVTEWTYDELKKLDAGEGEHIPLLSQVFDLINKRIVIDIELKGAGTAGPVAELLREYVYSRQWSPKNFLVTSFDVNMIKQFHQLFPEVPVGVIFDGSPTNYSSTLEHIGIKYAVIEYPYITEQLLNQTRVHDIKIFVYTVNDRSIANYLQEIGIDGIITDYPDIL